MKITGMIEETTNVRSHPVENVIARPEMNIPIVMRTAEFFSPIAPWNIMQSTANFDESSD